MSHQANTRFTFSVTDADDFEVVEFSLTEALSETFRLDIELSSPEADIDFARIVDRGARFVIWQDERPVRYLNGRISSFFQGETVFRRTRYRAVVEPPLARLALSSDWRIFQTHSAAQILRILLKEHGIAYDDQLLTEAHLPREYCVQAGETHLGFLQRLAAEEGIFHRFVHDAEGSRLVLGDHLYIHGAIDGGAVHYNPTPGGDTARPCLRRFTYGEHVRTGQQAQRDYSFKHPRSQQEYSAQAEDNGYQTSQYERFDYPGRYKQESAGVPFTRDRLRGLRRDTQVAVVEGDDPRLVPGVAFDLVGHPRQQWNHGWRPVHIRHVGRQSTRQLEESTDAPRGTHYSYVADIIPDRVEWRPAPLPRPIIPGPQIATVVGPPGEEFHVDEHGRVRVQFPWDRHSRNEADSSCWIRPAHAWAGTRWGQVALPRIGQEVIVDFLDGDCDQPVITNRLYRVTNPSPYKLPDHQALFTLKSKEHKGSRASELRLDDSNQQISAALMNDHGASHLHLGYLTHPRPDGGKPRGEGFELRTDLQGALRAAQGLLLSTEARTGAEGGQLDRDEIVATLEAALHLARSLGQHANQHQGMLHDAQPREQLTDAVRKLGQGANDQPGGNGAEPVMAFSAPAGIAAGTPRSIALAAGEHLDGAAQVNVQLTAGDRVVINAGYGLGTFTQRGDMRHIAHTGQLLLQAQHNDIRIEADRSVEISANRHHVTLSAEEHLTLLCGGAYIRMAGGNIEMGMPGTFTVKATDHNLVGPATMTPDLGRFPGLPGDFKEYFVLQDPHTQKPLPNHAYEIVRASGDILRGRTDENGQTEVVTSDRPEALEVTPIPDPDDLLQLEASYWSGDGEHSLDFLRDPTQERD